MLSDSILLNNYQVLMLIIWREKSCLDKRALIFSVFFRNSFVLYFILTRMNVIITLQMRIKIMLNRDFTAL